MPTTTSPIARIVAATADDLDSDDHVVALGGRARAYTHASHQAYGILRAGFIAAPLLAGADKFFGLLTDWEQYVAPALALPISAGAFMKVVGVVEIAAALVVAVRPRLGASVVAAWLGLIIINLLLLGRFHDVALRDFGLLLGALALERLASAHGAKSAKI